MRKGQKVWRAQATSGGEVCGGAHIRKACGYQGREPTDVMPHLAGPRRV